MKYWVLKNDSENEPDSIDLPGDFELDRLATRNVILWLNKDGTKLTHWARFDWDNKAKKLTPGSSIVKFKKPINSATVVGDAPGQCVLLNSEQLNTFFRLLRTEGKQRRIPEELAPCLEFEDVLSEELRAIDLLRGRRPRSRGIKCGKKAIYTAHDAHLTGLAFSGGGIRSATFNLGVLQALAKMKLLPCFDYLSTVSGGGYIGSWLVSWISRMGRIKVEEELPAEHAKEEAEANPENSQTRHPVTHLRRFSNYLTPKLGMFSADRWTMIATYGRNLILNLVILILALSAVLFLPRLVVSLSLWLEDMPTVIARTGLVFLAVGVLFVFKGYLSIETRRKESFLASQAWVQLLVVCPLFITAWMGSIWLWHALPEASFRSEWKQWLIESLQKDSGFPFGWVLIGGAVYAALWVIAIGSARLRGLFVRKSARDVTWLKILGIVVSAVVSGCVGGVLLLLLKNCLVARDFMPTVMACGPPLFIAVIILTAVLHVGLLGRSFDERHRQWWSRLGAWLLIYASIWVLSFAVALFGPVLLRYLYSPGVWGGLGLGWIGSTAAGLWAARSSTTSGALSKRFSRFLASIAPYIFVAGLMVLLALGIQRTMEWSAAADPSLISVSQALHLADLPPEPSVSFSTILTNAIDLTWVNETFPLWKILLITAGLGILAWILSMRIDINDFSMHLFYRSRLVRAYLGASHFGRRPHPFTGFDPEDDFEISGILDVKKESGAAGAATAASKTASDSKAPPPYDGPLPIINATLNLAAGRELAWQERKAASFVFTPLHCGFDKTLEKKKAAFRAIGAANERGGISLGTALTISGAAVNPNMGYHSVPSLAFLMTVFNARLGWWLKNPGLVSRYLLDCFTPGLWYLLSELLGQTRSTSRLVNLTDGGHFENLGIYELVKRRCRLIVACDAEADKNLTFGGLGNAIRKIRADHGIDIKLDVDPIKRQAESGFSGWHCAIGTIFYDKVDPGKPNGTLIYIKSSLTGDEAEDVKTYSTAHETFPHESTADQWFDESQFESYRQLGFHVAKEVFGAADIPARAEEVDIEKVAVDLRQAWYRPSVAVQKSFTTHARLLDEIFERIRKDEHLKFLDSEIYMELSGWKDGRPQTSDDEHKPGGEGGSDTEGKTTSESTSEDDKEFKPFTWDPNYHPTEDQFRAGFYLCNSVIQLMENVYIDLDLEHEWKHPDNRGWMNLFKHWSWSKMFKQTWSVSSCTYGARFQSFCERRLGLELGVVWGDKVAEKEQGALTIDSVTDAIGRLNYLECTLIRRLRKVHEKFTEQMVHVVPLEVHVLHPREAHLRKLEGSNTAPDSSDQKKPLLSFTIGFAILNEKPEGNAEPELVFMRIRDHLRKLGLGREALRFLKNVCKVRKPIELEKIVEQATGKSGVELLHETWPEVKWDQFNDIFQSVEREHDGKEEPVGKGA